jgi:hypothetical protein
METEKEQSESEERSEGLREKVGWSLQYYKKNSKMCSDINIHDLEFVGSLILDQII